MSVASVLIGLQASHEDGRGVTAKEFLEPLRIEPGEVEATRADTRSWMAGMVYFKVIRYSDFDHVDKSADAGAQSIAFDAGLVDAFQATAKFLDRRPPSVTQQLRDAGLSLRLFVDVRMDQDQMELDFPSDFLLACGRHGLRVYLMTNDIPAAEVFAAQQEPAD